MEPGAAEIDIQNEVGADCIAVADGGRVGLIGFRATIGAQPSSEGIRRQIQQIKEIVAGKNMLVRRQVLVYTSYILICISARGRR